jgi:hypothetical protein
MAEDTVEQFHSLLNREEYNAVCDLFDLSAKSRQDTRQFILDLQKLRRDDGNFVKTKLIKYEIEPRASFRAVHMIYETEYQNRQVYEEFVCHVDGDSGLLNFYGQLED